MPLRAWLKNTRRQVHAHALRKIGDFQIAEDITQETFLRVYQKLDIRSTLPRHSFQSGYMRL